MTDRVIVVERCEQCPHCYLDGVGDYVARRDACGKYIRDPHRPIPDFCPLPKKEGGE